MHAYLLYINAMYWYEQLFGMSWWPWKGPLGLLMQCVDLSSLSSDTSSQLDVLRHDGYSLGMDGTQVGVLKQTNQVSLTGLLESHDSRALEPQISLEVLGNLSHQTLEGQFSDEQLSRFLVSPDLSQSYSSWSVSVRLLYSSCGRCTLPGSLGSQLLPGSFSSSGFSCSLLSTCHDCVYSRMWCCNPASLSYLYIQIRWQNAFQIFIG